MSSSEADATARTGEGREPPAEVTVVFAPSGQRGRFSLQTSVLDAARSLGVDLDSVCGGRGICGRCQVRVSEGEFAREGIRSRASSLSPRGEPEARYDARAGLQQGRRLGCHARLLGDVVIDVPPDSQVHQQVVRKSFDTCDIELDPVIRLCMLELEPGAGSAALTVALERDWGLSRLLVAPAVTADLAAAVHVGGGRVTVAVRDGGAVVAVWPGLRERVLGLALDIGSTTIAAQLCELGTGEALADAGCMNPQIRFGEDLMSRVSYAMLHADGAEQMTIAVRQTLDELAGRLTGEAGATPEEILEIVVVGNPVMHHLFLGADPTPLGTAPFALAIEGPVSESARQLGVGAHASARVYVPPCVAGHIGADTAAVLLAEAPHRRDEVSLIVDVGTNAEIVLGNRERLLACSSPTGPAFEGGQISSGQRAAAGAIERVRIDRETLEPRLKVVGCELWSDDPGFEQAVSSAGVTGICGSGIIEALAEMFLAGILAADGTIRGDLAGRTKRLRPDSRTHCYDLWDGERCITVTQNDVRAIQLAKGALHAGARLLMHEMGVDRVDRIRLAGAFGAHIDPLRAMVLGMIPDCAPERVSAAGNAAGTGARIALLSGRARTEVEALVARIERIETATATRFQEEFVNAMTIPHALDPFVRLREATELPEAAGAPTNQASRRRRRPRRRR